MITRLERLSQPVLIFVSYGLLGIIGFIDYATGYEFSLSVFYVLPIAMVTWRAGRGLGLFSSVLSTLVWSGADLAAGHHYSQPIFPVWNALIRLAFFVIISLLLSALRQATTREAELARKDYLTGAVSSRVFYEIAQMEIDRLMRYKHPFTLAFIDLDNFKTVNDRFGHGIGDQVLRLVVKTLGKYTRKTDVIARLGGDEFALLLPETGQEAAISTLSKLQAGLAEVMHEHDWEVTLSIGALTCSQAPASTDELVRLADDLMYAAKRQGKNSIKCLTYAG